MRSHEVHVLGWVRQRPKEFIDTVRPAVGVALRHVNGPDPLNDLPVPVTFEDFLEGLLDQGVTPGKMEYYGLEYRYVTRYILNEISYDEMVNKLNTAIHQFAKRQMTYFRGMERRGIKIHWLDGYMPVEEKISRTIKLFKDKR